MLGIDGSLCVFCGSRANSKEHVFAKSVCERAGDINYPVTAGLSVEGKENLIRNPKPMPIQALTVRCVCKPCNNLWMSKLETWFISRLGPLIDLQWPQDALNVIEALKPERTTLAHWLKRHPAFGAEMPFLDWSDVLPAVFGWIIFPVIGTIIGVMGWQAIRRFFWNREQNKLYMAFESQNPMPTPPNPVEFDLELDESRFGEPATENYRLHILLRDGYTCQNCEQQFMEKDLEVHHIKIQAKGGTHHRTNLVTLCKSCHDREKWFGHKRMYPTTL